LVKVTATGNISIWQNNQTG